MARILRRIWKSAPILLSSIIWTTLSLCILKGVSLIAFLIFLLLSSTLYIVYNVKRRILVGLYKSFHRELQTGILNCSDLIKIRENARCNLIQVLLDNQSNYPRASEENLMKIVSNFKSYCEIVRYTSPTIPLCLVFILSMLIFLFPPIYSTMLSLILFSVSLSFLVTLLLLNKFRSAEYRGWFEVVNDVKLSLNFIKDLLSLIKLNTPFPQALYSLRSNYKIPFNPLWQIDSSDRYSTPSLIHVIIELSQEIACYSIDALKTWLRDAYSFISGVYESISKLYVEAKLSTAVHLLIFSTLGLITGCILGVWPIISTITLGYSAREDILLFTIVSVSTLVNLIEFLISDISSIKFALSLTVLGVLTSILSFLFIWCLL